MQYTKEQIERAARRLFAGMETFEPGTFDIEFFRERVAADPDDYVRPEDMQELPFPRCEFYAEAGESPIGTPLCYDPVTTAIYVDRTVDCDGFVYSCDAHAPEFAKEDGYIRMQPLHPVATTI